jgi:hypothetical protein
VEVTMDVAPTKAIDAEKHAAAQTQMAMVRQ